MMNRGHSVVSCDDIDGVARDEKAAMALPEYLRLATSVECRVESRRQLLQYCELDTSAVVEIPRVVRAACGSQ